MDRRYRSELMRKVFSFSFIWQMGIYCISKPIVMEPKEKKTELNCNTRTKEEKSPGISDFHTMKPASKLNKEGGGKRGYSIL